MKFKFPNLLFLFIIAMSFASCCQELHFDDDEMFWVDVYNKGDVLVFGSAHTLNDTLFITNKTSYMPKGECNFLVSQYDEQSCVIDYKYKHGNKMLDSDLFVQHFKEHEGESVPVIRVYGLEYNKGDQEVLKDTSVVLDVMKIKLNDCYVFHKKDCYDGWSEFKIKTFVWSRKRGLVMFVGEKGQKYELITKLTKKK